MQDTSKQKEKQKKVDLQTLSLDERHRLVGAFVWLLEQDKKQNPALYQLNNSKNDRHSMPSNT